MSLGDLTVTSVRKTLTLKSYIPHHQPLAFPPSVPSAGSPLTMVKGNGGVKFTVAEFELLPEVVDEIIPIGVGNPNWEKVSDQYWAS